MLAWLKRTTADLLYAGSLIVGIVAIAFFFFQAFPTDPARLALGPGAGAETVERLRDGWGLNRPLGERFISYIGGLARLDLGTTYRDNRSVSLQIGEKFAVTASIGLRASLLALAASYLIHLLAFCVPRLRFLAGGVATMVAIPSFLAAILGGILVSILAPGIALSRTGDRVWNDYWLPVCILAIYPVALLTRVLVRKIDDGRRTLYFQAQAAAGFSNFHLFNRCLLRPALVSWLAALFNHLSLLFLATMIVEIIFTIPGVGQLLALAVQRSDFPLIQGILVLNGVFFIVLHFLSEQVYKSLNPAVRAGRSSR